MMKDINRKGLKMVESRKLEVGSLILGVSSFGHQVLALVQSREYHEEVRDFYFTIFILDSQRHKYQKGSYHRIYQDYLDWGWYLIC